MSFLFFKFTIMKKIFLISLIALFSACSSGSADKTKTIDHDGSIEAVLSVEHLPNVDVLHVERKVWVRNQSTIYTSFDTIPALGTTVDTAENANGDDTVVTLKKNYQIFITVK
jgi:hypothetical protein